MAHPSYYWLALLPLVWVRIRRSVGFRKFGGRRLLLPIALFVAMLALVVSVNAHHVMGWIANGAGSVLGAALGVMAIRETEFQKRADGLYYRTHLGIQVAVLFLFLMRMAYRLFEILEEGESGKGNGPLHAFQDPVTISVISMLFVYNLVYFVYVFQKGGRLAKTLSARSPLVTE
jgi:hypothetical protein